MNKPAKAIVDLTGRHFAHLTVVGECERDKWNKRRWRCVCDCGRETTVTHSNLVRGATKSCGCLVRRVHSQKKVRHGQAHTRLYKIWSNMKDRCLNRNSSSWQWYGARGITVCHAWMDFSPFASWAKSNGYADDLTIDRIDSNSGYSPENCRWVGQEQQQRNRTNTKLSEAAVREIRESKLPREVLAGKYGVTPRHVSRVRSRTTWESVE